MKDIIVTVPQTNYSYFLAYKMDEDETYWELSVRPKYLEIGCKIGFVMYGRIYCVAIMTRISTSRSALSRKPRYRIHFKRCHPVTINLPHKSFQSFRYYKLPELS